LVVAPVLTEDAGVLPFGGACAVCTGVGVGVGAGFLVVGLTVGGLTVGGLTAGGFTVGGLTVGGFTVGGCVVVVTGAEEQVGGAIVSFCRVTAPFRASTRPSTVTPVFNVAEVRAMIVPEKSE
jgi:hypothetical protein